MTLLYEILNSQATPGSLRTLLFSAEKSSPACPPMWLEGSSLCGLHGFWQGPWARDMTLLFQILNNHVTPGSWRTLLYSAEKCSPACPPMWLEGSSLCVLHGFWQGPWARDMTLLFQIFNNHVTPGRWRALLNSAEKSSPACPPMWLKGFGLCGLHGLWQGPWAGDMTLLSVRSLQRVGEHSSSALRKFLQFALPSG